MSQVTKHISLSKNLERRLAKAAKERGKNLSEMFREIALNFLNNAPKRARKTESYENLRSIIGMVDSGHSDISANHDKYLYENADIH